MQHDTRLEPVRAYLRRRRAESLGRLRTQLEAREDLVSRANMRGHLTASGLVLTPGGCEVLIIGHKGSGKWLQPGGHLEADAEIWLAASREIREETGVADVRLHPWHSQNGLEPVDINSHEIPARPAKGEGPHWHHDCLYVFHAAKTPPEAQEEEVFAAIWCAVDDPRVPARLTRALRMMAG